MFMVDLENEMIVNKPGGEEENKAESGEQEQMSESKHPVLFN